ncbi:MAG: pyridoxamine 5'-phosphate oxidase family protein [Jatrophihabitantaceae bacterium]
MEVLDGIDAKLQKWLLAQPMFVVATAPLSGTGHVNASPKGMAGTFAVLDRYRVGYLDYYGSGVETIAHLRENGRITLMFSAFTGKTSIIRLYGQGRVVLPEDAEFAELRRHFDKERVTAQRAIVVVDLDRVQDSCGYAVPLMDFVADRSVLDLHQEKKGAAAYALYPTTKNARSIDGIPGLDPATIND